MYKRHFIINDYSKQVPKLSIIELITKVLRNSGKIRETGHSKANVTDSMNFNISRNFIVKAWQPQQAIPNIKHIFCNLSLISHSSCEFHLNFSQMWIGFTKFLFEWQFTKSQNIEHTFIAQAHFLLSNSLIYCKIILVVKVWQ